MDDLTKRVARLVRNYVEHVWPHLERSGGTPDEPMQAAKGSSNPPVSDWVLGLIDANRVASHYLHWALEATLEEDWVSKERDEDGKSVRFADILRTLRHDPGAAETWRDGRASVAAGYPRSIFWAYREMLVMVARGVIFVHGRTDKERAELERRLNLSPDDPEALVVRRHPLEEDETRGRTRKGQVIDTMHTRRLMVEQLEQLEASTDYRGLAAMEVLSERKAKEGKDWSVEKLRHARKAVNRERQSEAGEVA